MEINFFLIWPHSLTNIEIQKYLPSDITLLESDKHLKYEDKGVNAFILLI